MEFFHHDVLSNLFILHMHHCIMEIRVEFLSHCFDRLHTKLIQCCGKLLVDHFHSICKSIAFLCLCKTSFKVIHNRQDLFNDLFCSDDVHTGFFFFRSFTEIIKFSHGTLQAIGKFLHLLLRFIFFLLSEEGSF